MILSYYHIIHIIHKYCYLFVLYFVGHLVVLLVKGGIGDPAILVVHHFLEIVVLPLHILDSKAQILWLAVTDDLLSISLVAFGAFQIGSIHFLESLIDLILHVNVILQLFHEIVVGSNDNVLFVSVAGVVVGMVVLFEGF